MGDLQIQYLPVNSIALDLRNPRVAPMLESLASLESEPSQEWIALALDQYSPDDADQGGSTTFSSLKASIRKYKGLELPRISGQLTYESVCA